MFDVRVLALIVASFLLAGVVKGVVGLGLPSVALGVPTATLGLQPAMALIVVPSFVTNVWQAVAGGNWRAIIARTWPFLLAATVTVWLGAMTLTRVDASLLLLGLYIVTRSLDGYA